MAIPRATTRPRRPEGTAESVAGSLFKGDSATATAYQPRFSSGGTSPRFLKVLRRRIALVIKRNAESEFHVTKEANE